MRIHAAIIMILGAALLTGQPGHAQDVALEGLLRVQVFNKVFEGFDFYRVVIEEDQLQADGSREVTAVATGRFLEHTERMKVLFLIVGEQVVGGQVLEGTRLPPCLSPDRSPASL